VYNKVVGLSCCFEISIELNINRILGKRQMTKDSCYPKNNCKLDEAEKLAKEWLISIGATDIQYCGDQNNGPPDFRVSYKGRQIAVEVTRMDPHHGWEKKKECAFEWEVEKVVKKNNCDPSTPNWHVVCAYDPGVKCPSKKNTSKLLEKVLKELKTKDGLRFFQELLEKKFSDGGITFYLTLASNEGSFSGVCVDRGFLVAEKLEKELVKHINKKKEKVKKVILREQNRIWWLVIEDRILQVTIRQLGQEWDKVKKNVKKKIDVNFWNKVVILGRDGSSAYL